MAHSLSYSLSFPSSVFFFQSTLIFLFLSFLQILYLEVLSTLTFFKIFFLKVLHSDVNIFLTKLSCTLYLPVTYILFTICPSLNETFILRYIVPNLLQQTILGIQEKARSDDRIDEADKLARFDYYWWTRCHVRELDCSRESYNSDHRYRCRYSEMRLEKQTFESHIQSLCWTRKYYTCQSQFLFNRYHLGIFRSHLVDVTYCIYK